MLSTNISLNILTIGYRTDNMYFQFTMNEKASLRASFSKGPVELLLKGNAPYLGKTLTANVALSASEYREYGLSVAYGAGNDLWLGVRAKLLFGHAGAHSPKNTISLHTDSQTYALTLKSDILMMASYPGKYDEQTDLFTSEIDVSHFISNPINVGGAIDLGVTKVFENGLKLSASILNIGMINWGKNTHLLYKNAASLRYGGPTAGITQWKDLTDTLKSIVRLRYAEKGTFPQWLAPEIMAGVSYPVIDYMRVGITGYGGISSIGIPWAITATALTDNTSHVYGALSYTITGNSPVNVGAGFGVRLGAFNMHVITDNILAFFATSSQRYATVQFGINFKFGCGGEGGGNSKQYKSVPCPSFGHTPSSRLMSAVPCASGK
jgi:hypothetical protein